MTAQIAIGGPLVGGGESGLAIGSCQTLASEARAMPIRRGRPPRHGAIWCLVVVTSLAGAVPVRLLIIALPLLSGPLSQGSAIRGLAVFSRC